MLDPTRNRWLVVVGAVLVQLALGSIYAWSVYTDFLKDPEGPYRFTTTQTQAIFSVGLATFAVVMVLAGRLMARIGPRRVALGGVLLGIGYILAGLFGSTFMSQLVLIGLVGGAGIGLGYVTPIAVGMRWFPDKKGLITGLAVAGFGAGAFLWNQLAGPWGPRYLYHLSINGLPGVQSTFLLYGIVYTVMVLVGSIWMVYPPDGWHPKGWKPAAAGAGGAAAAVEFESSEMLRTPQFFLLMLTFAFSAFAGLMTLGIIKLFGIDALMSGGLAKEVATPTAATAAGVFLALFNGIGRITWGTVADRIGWRRSVIAMCLLQGATMLAFFWMGTTTALLYLGAALIGFNFGGNFALFPMATADTFGSRNVGKNYGWMFLAYGLAGIAGPITAAYYKDVGSGQGVGAWLTPFIIAGVLSFVGSVLVWRVTRPAAPRAAFATVGAAAGQAVARQGGARAHDGQRSQNGGRRQNGQPARRKAEAGRSKKGGKR